VSEFFRDLSYFKTLREVILPEILRNYIRLNIWSAGCSNGAEPYSIAIILDNISPYGAHRILATDIDEGSLIKAMGGGPYRADEIRNVPPQLRNHFIKTAEGYEVTRKIREMVEFRRHDLFKDNFEDGFNLIICRNVVIYFSYEAKNKLYHKFNNSLKDDGVLFIGGTEAMLDASDMRFQMLRTCFYRKSLSNKNEARVLTPV
jgi:chemotaxis protein methyltransferase CheR